jgi:hypothetical protein
MHKDVRKDMQQGMSDLKKALPLLAEHCSEFGRGQFKFTCEESGEIAVDLDMLAGFDAYQRGRAGMRGIAARAQRCNGTSFRTFTIRVGRASGAQTEYEKRLWAVRHKDHGAMYPYWTVQSYSTRDGSQVLSIGLARTEELYLFIEAQEKRGYPFKPRMAGTETFIAVSWDSYKRSGGFFYEYAARVQESVAG